MKMILISPEKNISNEQQYAMELVESGFAYFHIRKPYFSDKELANYVSQFREDVKQKLVIHRHLNFANQNGFLFHFRYAELTAEEKGGKHSVSVHHVQEYLKVNGNFHYAFISPVFDSISKPGYLSNSTIKEVVPLKGKTDLIALGGIHKGNIQNVHDMGFDGAAICGAVWNSENPLKEGLDILHTASQLKML